MKFTYRGISYENSPAEDATQGEVGGKYRGATWRHRYPRHVPVPQPIAELKYRGVDYCIGHPIDVEISQLRKQYENVDRAVTPESGEVNVEKRDRASVLAELNTIHLANIRSNLERRLAAARAKGDRNLIRLLEAEAEQLKYSSVR